jgi:hypothetical protein
MIGGLQAGRASPQAAAQCGIPARPGRPARLPFPFKRLACGRQKKAACRGSAKAPKTKRKRKTKKEKMKGGLILPFQ